MSNDRSYSQDVLSDLSNTIKDVLKRGKACCPNCVLFAPFKETCTLNNLRPPAPIIAFGCECYENDNIPFQELRQWKYQAAGKQEQRL